MNIKGNQIKCELKWLIHDIKFENYIQTNDGDENETPRSSMLYQTDDEDDVSEDIEEDGETLGEDESVQEDI